jgi:acyl transferase domain-containing protein
MGAGKLTDHVSVAVVGLSCRFPGDGDSLEEFWDFICAGKCKYIRADPFLDDGK